MRFVYLKLRGASISKFIPKYSVALLIDAGKAAEKKRQRMAALRSRFQKSVKGKLRNTLFLANLKPKNTSLEDAEVNGLLGMSSESDNVNEAGNILNTIMLNTTVIRTMMTIRN